MSRTPWKVRGLDALFVIVTAGVVRTVDSLLGASDALAVLPKWRVVAHLGLCIGWGVLIARWVTDLRKRFTGTGKKS